VTATSILSGVRVFDMTLAAVGPWASKLLGQLGADVIKVESPEPEMSHQIPPKVKGTGVLYISANFNKRQIVLDLKNDEERAKAYKLARHCDVFIQNMRPGAAEKLGFGYDDIVALRPDVIYVTSSAYGRVGPMATDGGVDPLLQAFSGFTSITGPSGSDGEMFRHLAHLDITTSSNIVEAVLQALVHRERTGQGQHIEIEMVTAALALQHTRLAEYFATGHQPEPMGSASATTVPHQAFCCQDREWLAVGVTEERLWPAFCQAMQLTELVLDARYETNADRVANRAPLEDLLTERFATKPAAWWAHRLTQAGVPNSRILDFDLLRSHPQVVANQHLVQLDTPHFGSLTVDAVPWDFTATPAGPVVAGGLQGEHSAQIRAQFKLDEADPAP
jgi:crotonobetainyl-CoA:carnitine CoA-transferase CaiB-like acyl-CoA transferase